MSHRAHTNVLSGAVFFTLVSSVDGATLNVANNGLDQAGCGSKASPCRSISHAVNAIANDGDSIVVGPGRYGDLNGDGALANSSGEESGGFGCVLLVARSVTITSSHGAASTMIDSTNVPLNCNVGIAVDGTKFGKSGKGFMVTNTFVPPNSSMESSAILVNATNVTVAGNQVLALVPIAGFTNFGIATVDAPQTVLVEGNQVMGWSTGIMMRGANKTVRSNQVSWNCLGGITLSSGSSAIGNVTVGNGRSGLCVGPGVGITLNGTSTAVGNGAYGNATGYRVDPAFSGSLSSNNLVGNRVCGLDNQGASDVLATQNYWGAATGPGPDPADDVCNQNTGTTTVTPFATKAFRVKARAKP